MKDRIKSVSFWAGIAGAVILVLGAFGVEIGDDTASAIVNAVCSLLVFFGIASVPNTSDEVDDEADKLDVISELSDIDGIIHADMTDGVRSPKSKNSADGDIRH